jgi:PPOX class probable F420-dependent enzyme
MTTTTGELEGDARTFVGDARHATLGTVAPDGRPRLVPVCFVLAGEVVFIALDDKPKRSADPMELARVQDILARPTVSLLVDVWDEDWSKLGWVRVDGLADLVGPRATGHAEAVAALRAKYPQYAGHALDGRPLIRIAIEHVVAWSAAPPP